MVILAPRGFRSVLGVSIALVASAAIALPVSTPPNAVAFPHGVVEARDLAFSGVIIGIVSYALIVAGGPWIIRF